AVPLGIGLATAGLRRGDLVAGWRCAAGRPEFCAAMDRAGLRTVCSRPKVIFGSPDMWMEHCRLTTLIGVTTLLAACSSAGPSAVQIPVPESQGIYAIVDSDELQRLDGNPEWERETWGNRSDLRADQQFVIYDPILAE